MTIDTIRSYCLNKAFTEETLPFGPDVLVFKVAGKIFLLLPLDTESLQFNAKCDPGRAQELRDAHSCILPGYHMNKAKWNTILVDGSLKQKQLLELIDHSYEQVVQGLPKKIQKQIFPDEHASAVR